MPSARWEGNRDLEGWTGVRLGDDDESRVPRVSGFFTDCKTDCKKSQRNGAGAEKPWTGKKTNSHLIFLEQAAKRGTSSLLTIIPINRVGASGERDPRISFRKL